MGETAAGLERAIRLPDIGEGVAEAELVEWLVAVGQNVAEDQPLAAVMTDKATVEIPSPVAGRVLRLGATVGQRLAVGAELIRLAVASGASAPAPPPPPVRASTTPEPSSRSPSGSGAAVEAAPAVRARAKALGLDLGAVRGTGPGGRVSMADVEAAAAPVPEEDGVIATPVIGLRRRIAERLSDAWARIPHITYVEEVDVTDLEALRARLAGDLRRSAPTPLAFLMRALVGALAEHPHLNAHYDDRAGVLRRHAAVHVGLATRTDAGLLVPVVRHVERRDLLDCAAEAARVAQAARAATASRAELTGSTITISSLGALGGLVSTPLVNPPEVAIVGVNKIRVAPVWDGAAFRPRKLMNLSSSFDHRIVDGWDAAAFVQKLKAALEAPQTLLAPPEPRP